MKKLLFLFLLVLIPNLAQAEQYTVSVTRVESNFYKVDYGNLLIKTKWCYEYAYSQRAIVTLNGYYDMKIQFDRNNTCEVEAIYEKIR